MAASGGQGGLPAGRLRALVGAFSLLAAVVVAQLWSLQVVRGGDFRALAEEGSTRTFAPYDRGAIYLTRADGKREPAATLATGYVVVVTPAEVEDAAAIYDALLAAASTSLALDRERFLARAAPGRGGSFDAASRVPESVGEAIDALELPGVALRRDRWRSYPGDELLAQVLGFVGWDGDERAGAYGLERRYEDTLGRAAGGQYANFFAEVFAGARRAAEGKRAGGDLVTSIEPAAQAYLEETLRGVGDRYGAREVGGIVLDPSDGRIIAMAGWPTFDPNDYGAETDAAVYQNPNVERVYEFGSIVKALTMAIGLDAGAVTPSTTYEDRGSLTFDGKTIYNFDLKGRGVVDMQTVLSKSLNTGVAFVAQEVGNERFARYLDDFLSGTTGIDLPNEATPLLENLSSGRDIEIVTASFGQGIAVSPIAMARALAALGNGGRLVQPHVVTSIDYEMGAEIDVGFEPPRRVISEDAARGVTGMLVRVVDEALLDGSLAIPGYSAAAKTGTAELPDDSGGYHDDRFVHSFFAYAPATEPRFLVLTYAVDPRGETYASRTLAAPSMELMKFLLGYFQVPPDRAGDAAALGDAAE
jgi:cell division protein FtsI/penicillin-binding protein 2